MPDWNQLKNNQCPSCESYLKIEGQYHVCTNRVCDFSCDIVRFNQIIRDMYTPKRRGRRFHNPTEDENRDALNEL